MNSETLNTTIGQIYDCSVDPDLWVDTLTIIRDEMNLAFVSMNHMSFPSVSPDAVPDMEIFNTQWDQSWLDSLPALVPLIPKWEEMRNSKMDEPISQLQLVDEAEFRESEFCRKWVEPQGLRDTFNLKVIDRSAQFAMVSATTYMDRDLFDRTDYNILKTLSPHLRRSMLISSVVEEQHSWIQIYNRLLDEISAAIFLVNDHSRVLYHNAQAETLLSDGAHLTSKLGILQPTSEEHMEAFSSTIKRACSMEDQEIGYWGNGMALPDQHFNTTAAYVLPLGRSERRHALGPGQAAVFVSTDKSMALPAVEVLSAFSGLTTTEARIAISIAEGQSTDEVAKSGDITISTLRTHLANIYAKLGVKNQAGLAAFVNRLRLPVL